jgi:hypothetical protein
MSGSCSANRSWYADSRRHLHGCLLVRAHTVVGMGTRLIADSPLALLTNVEATTGEDVWANDQHHVLRLRYEWVYRRELSLGW